MKYLRRVNIFNVNFQGDENIYFNDKDLWLKLMKNAYDTDNSWNRRIKNYIKFYKKISD